MQDAANGTTDRVVEDLSDRHEPACSEAERVERLLGRDRELRETAGDPVVVEEGERDEWREPDGHPARGLPHPSPLPPRDEHRVREQRCAPQHRVERTGQKDPTEQYAGHEEQPLRSAAETGEEGSPEEQAEPEREQVRQVHAALDHDDRRCEHQRRRHEGECPVVREHAGECICAEHGEDRAEREPEFWRPEDRVDGQEEQRPSHRVLREEDAVSEAREPWPVELWRAAVGRKDVTAA